MNANDVLIDLLEDNQRRLHRLFAIISDDCLFWKPGPEANNIAVTAWHMARILDVYFIQYVRGRTSEEEDWIRQGWADQTHYDPHGIGQNGLGMLTGYTQEEVAMILNSRRSNCLAILMMFITKWRITSKKLL